MFGMGKSTDFSRCGIGYNSGRDGFGVTAYNNTGGKLNLGDVVSLFFTGTEGQELKAIIPVTNAVQCWQGVCDDALGIANGSIGKIQVYGKAKARVLGSASITAAGKYLESMNRIAFDGIATHLTFVAGSGATRDTITDSDSGLVADGFLAGMRIVIAGATTAGNNGSWEIYSIAAGTMTLTTIGQVTSEAGASGLTMLTHGYLEYSGTVDATDTIAVAREAYITTTAVATKDVQLQGLPKIVSAS